MLTIQCPSPSAALVELASEGRVHRLLFLADFVQHGSEHISLRDGAEADIVLLCAPTLTSLIEGAGSRTLAVHSTVQLLALAGVHGVESCQNEETVRIPDSQINLVPYQVTPALVDWVVQLATSGENLFCFSCREAGGGEGPALPPARHYFHANAPYSFVPSEGQDSAVVSVPEPYMLHMSRIAQLAPVRLAERTLPRNCIQALTLLANAPVSRRAKEEKLGENLVFVLESELDLLPPTTKVIAGFFARHATRRDGDGGECRFLEGEREMEQIACCIEGALPERTKVKRKGLCLAWGSEEDNSVQILGRNRFRIRCPRDLALAKRLAKLLCELDYSKAVRELEPPITTTTTTTTTTGNNKRIKMETMEDPAAQRLLDLLCANAGEITLSDAAQDGRAGDKKEIVLLVKRFPAKFELKMNASTGKRVVTLL